MAKAFSATLQAISAALRAALSVWVLGFFAQVWHLTFDLWGLVFFFRVFGFFLFSSFVSVFCRSFLRDHKQDQYNCSIRSQTHAIFQVHFRGLDHWSIKEKSDFRLKPKSLSFNKTKTHVNPNSYTTFFSILSHSLPLSAALLLAFTGTNPNSPLPRAFSAALKAIWLFQTQTLTHHCQG